MKARNLYLATAVCAGSLAIGNVANAQDVFVDDAVSVTEFTCDNSNHYFSNWRDNWFIEIGAGANQPLVEKGTAGHTQHSVMAKKWTASYSFGFGRWMSPYLGFRIKAIGGALHWDTPVPGAEQYGWSRSKHVGLHAELMWDMFNSIGGGNPDRVFSIIPFVGLRGGVHWGF